MSATLSNIEDLQRFLKCDLFLSDFRPVQLTEFVKLGPAVYELRRSAGHPNPEWLKFGRPIPSPSNSEQDPDNLLYLVSEVIPDKSCLVFCPTKKNAENLAFMLAKLLPRELKCHKFKQKVAFLRALKQECDNRLCTVLERCIPYGIAYHHSGLTAEERSLIQNAFADGTLCVLCCTSTLAAGVNLPAKRVIIRSATMGNRALSPQEYKQMCGRAGRAGLDTCGESVTVLQEKNKRAFLETMCSSVNPCRSGLLAEGAKGIRSLLLSLIALQVTTSVEQAKRFLENTLLGIQAEQFHVSISTLVEVALSDLKRFLVFEKEGELKATSLGMAVCKGPVDIEVAGKLLATLTRPLKHGLVLSTHLHLLYCIVPYDLADDVTPNWSQLYEEFCNMSVEEKRVFELEGVTEADIVRKLSRSSSNSQGAKSESEANMKRLYMAVILNRLWKQELVWDVARKFGLPRGWVQNFLQSSATFASCVSRFCSQLPELWPYQSLLPDFVRRLTHCCQAELIPLMEIHGVKLGRARQLYNAGYKSVGSLSVADPEQLVRTIEHLSRRQAKEIVRSAKVLTEEQVLCMMDNLQDLYATDQIAELTNENVIEKLKAYT